MHRRIFRAPLVRGFVPAFTLLFPLAGVLTACSEDEALAPTAIASVANFGKNVTGSNQRILS